MQTLVRDNTVERAVKALKCKLQREGMFRDMKRRAEYEKPFEMRARERAETVFRVRNRAWGEGLLPALKGQSMPPPPAAQCCLMRE